MLLSDNPTVKELQDELELVRYLLAEAMGCASICPFNCDAYKRMHAYLYNVLPLPKSRKSHPAFEG